MSIQGITKFGCTKPTKKAHPLSPIGAHTAIKSCLSDSKMRLVNQIFAEQTSNNIEMYVDQHVTNLAKTFAILREYGMKLNSAKYVFGVGSGKFLGFMVRHRGIEANRKKSRPSLI